MATNLKAIQINKDAANEGVWCMYRGGVSFKVGSLESPAFQEAQYKRLKANPREYADWEEDERHEFQIQNAADALLLGWKPEIELDEDEGPLEFSRENAVRILSDPDLDVLDWVYMRAADSMRFTEAVVARAAGNSPGSSNGASDTARSSSDTESSSSD